MLGSHVGLQLCSICLSFSCIVYSTKLQHGDPDVQVTLSSDYKAIERDISFVLILHDQAIFNSTFEETLCKTPLEG